MYKSIFVFLIGSLVIAAGISSPAWASGANGPLRAIVANAADMRANAGIYQWHRMNSDLTRIVAAERSLNHTEAATLPGLSDVDATTQSLRAAWTAHDIGRIQRLTQALDDVCAHMQ
jgi:Xaa-Pro aminopeptidase